jgi:hypothetical protein
LPSSVSISVPSPYHRGDDQDTLDLIRELMDLNVTLVLIGAGIPGSGLLRGAPLMRRGRRS